MTSPNRRQLMAGSLAAVGAATAPAMPALADAAPDPILAAIEAHRAAAARFEATLDVQERLEDELPTEARQSQIFQDDLWIKVGDDPRWIEAMRDQRDTCAAVDELGWAFVETPPVTAAGNAALMAYVEGAPDGWFPEDCLPALWRILARGSANGKAVVS